MEKKLEVKICTCTLCYVMGGAELQLIDEFIPDDIIDKIDIKGAPGLEYCNGANGLKAPFVMVGDRVISEASISKVVDAIKEELASL